MYFLEHQDECFGTGKCWTSNLFSPEHNAYKIFKNYEKTIYIYIYIYIYIKKKQILKIITTQTLIIFFPTQHFIKYKTKLSDKNWK